MDLIEGLLLFSFAIGICVKNAVTHRFVYIQNRNKSTSYVFTN